MGPIPSLSKEPKYEVTWYPTKSTILINPENKSQLYGLWAIMHVSQ